MISLTRRSVLLAGTAALTACAIPVPPSQQARRHGGYLLVHFTGESPDGEQLYFAASRDGMHWTDLNGSQPVLRSNVGEKGVRDPSILRTASGKYVILATDLRIASGKGWHAAQHAASTQLVIVESADLLNWSAPRLVDIAGSIPKAGCAWAPEAIYDEANRDYLVYWSTISPLDGVTKARVYYSRTRDFVRFTPAQLYIDRPGDHGLIDTQIVKVEQAGSPYRYYRASGDGQITVEGSNALLGEWTALGDLRRVGLTGKDVEGPILFRLEATGQWVIWADQYATGKGYLAVLADDLSRPERFSVLPASAVDFGASRKRHGSILSLDAAEYDAVMAKWGRA
jgi:hypothetical protein